MLTSDLCLHAQRVSGRYSLEQHATEQRSTTSTTPSARYPSPRDNGCASADTNNDLDAFKGHRQVCFVHMRKTCASPNALKRNAYCANVNPTASTESPMPHTLFGIMPEQYSETRATGTHLNAEIACDPKSTRINTHNRENTIFCSKQAIPQTGKIICLFNPVGQAENTRVCYSTGVQVVVYKLYNCPRLDNIKK